MHAGLWRPDNVPALALDEAAQAARELALIPDLGLGVTKVGLVLDHDSALAWNIQPQGRDFSYFRLVFDTH
jgi:beta-galactosidase